MIADYSSTRTQYGGNDDLHVGSSLFMIPTLLANILSKSLFATLFLKLLSDIAFALFYSLHL